MKSIYLIVPIFILMSSCVSKKKFDDINSRLLDMENAKADLEALVNKKNDALDSLTDIIRLQEQKLDSLTDQNTELQDDLANKQKAFENLKSSYDALEKQSSASLAANSKQNRKLLAKLEEKREMLNEKQSRLSGLQKDLNKREQRIRRLEQRIAEKEQQMDQLKQNLQKALIDFQGKGLEVEQRNGNVYVSMENKLLFGSGSWNVGSQGKKAIQELSKVLANNPDINVLIEGHTDNVPYNGNEMIEDNWDLSTKRATEVLKLILSSSSIDAERLTAAGRGKFMPVASNETGTGRAKNRRIEVVLSPKLSNLSEMINTME